MKCHFQWILCISAAALCQVIVSVVQSYFTLDFVVFKMLHVLTVFAVLTLLPLPWGLTHSHVIDIHGHVIDTLMLAVQTTNRHQTKLLLAIALALSQETNQDKQPLQAMSSHEYPVTTRKVTPQAPAMCPVQHALLQE